MSLPLMTQQDIVLSALVLIQEAAQGELLTANESYDGTDRLNALLALWNTLGKHVYVITNYSGALTASTYTYAIGTGATSPGFNTARPVKIQSAGIIAGGIRTPIEIWNSKKWASIHDKATAVAAIPEGIYNDNAYPLANLNVWPAPIGTPTLDLYFWGEFASFTNYLFTDLVVSASSTSKVSSALYGFTSADAGNYINIPLQQSGAFTPGRYLISSVSAGVATLTTAIGSVNATGGIGSYDQAAAYPPGYLKAIRYNLAVDLAPEYGRQAAIGDPANPASIAGIALSTMQALRGLNESNLDATEDPAPPAPVER